MLESILNQAKQQADSVEILFTDKKNAPLNFYNWRGIDVIERHLRELSIRVIRNGRLGVAVGSLTARPGDLIDSALQAAAVGPRVLFDFPSTPSSGGGGIIHDPRLAAMTTDDIVADGRAIYDYVKKQGGRFGLNLYFDNECKEVSILNSNGKHESYRSTTFTASLLSMYERSKEGINKEITSCRYFTFPRQIIDELIAENDFSSRLCEVPARPMPVLFRASSTWALLYRVLEGVNGHNVNRGLTPLMDKLNTRIFGDNVTLIDDPTMDYAPGATPFDDEGVPTDRKFIVENGILRNFIFDLDAGAKAKRASTGNGLKRSMWMSGMDIMPGPRFNNLVMEPGDRNLADMVADMAEGLIVNDVIGFHSGNILQGHYSMNVGIGFYVRGGKIQGRAADTMIAGNIYQDFHRIEARSNRLERNNLAYSPDLLISDISVIGTA
ncbi:TldD/PmbA family protein [bacterium]|nr:TldD/PmbA family protein [candidate division CSSED10-310 bacterium]